MTGYSKALCSILGTLMVLAFASPGLAQGKKKKKAAEEPAPAAASAEAEGGGSLDSLMESAADKKDKKKKGKAEEEAAPAEEAPPAEEEIAEPDAWERPPVEEKAPPKQEAPKAEEPAIALPISVGLLLGYGFTTDRKDFGADPYGLMAGLRGGYTLDFALYLGVYFNYYLGGSQRGQNAITASDNRESTASYMQFGLEVGYDAYLGPIILRPSLGIGIAMAFADPMGETVSISDLMFAPGVTVLYPIDEFFLGGDLRGNIVTGDGVSGITVAATGGIRF